MEISIVIPNFNGKNLLEKNLPFVFEAKKNKKNNIKEVIVVDDASFDDSVSFLNTNYKSKVKLIVHEKNKGFSGSINSGVKGAKGELVCLLNSDVVPSKKFLETIQEDFQDQLVFAVSLHEKGYGYAKGKFENGFIIHKGIPESQKIEESFWASGGSSVVRRDIFNKLGGMDDRVLSPFYWEDIDLSYRAQKRGFKVLWDPNANVIHEHESTIKNLDQKFVSGIRERNQLLFIWKNLTSNNLIKKHIFALLKRVISHPGYLRIVLKARVKWKDVLIARKKEIKETIVSDEAIFERFN